jgi:hypothetical protein
MRAILAAAAAVLLALPATGQAQSLRFDTAAYLTCRDAQAMTVDQRKALAIFLAEHAARYRGVVIPQGEQGVQLASLVRGGCTLAPDAYLFTVIDRAIVAELPRLPRR